MSQKDVIRQTVEAIATDVLRRGHSYDASLAFNCSRIPDEETRAKVRRLTEWLKFLDQARDAVDGALTHGHLRETDYSASDLGIPRELAKLLMSDRTA